MGNIQFRQMNEGDIQAVARLEQKIFSAPWSEKSFRDAVRSADNCYLVAVSGETVIGYCGLWCSYDCADLCNLAVSEEFREQKLGSELLSRAMLQVRGRGVRRIVLEVRRSNTPAIALYDKLGFQNIGIRPGYYSRPTEDGILMERIL